MLSAAPLAANTAVTITDNANNRITVNAKKAGAEIQPTMYGIFFEDINYAADGGLYAELVMNRSFEFPNPYAGWEISGKVSLKDDGPFERNPHYVRLAPSGHAHKHTMIENQGFFGIGVKAGEDYRFSVWARVPDGGKAKLWIDLVDNASMGETQKFANAGLDISGSEWKKYSVIIKSKKTFEKAHLRVWGDKKVTTDLEHISLFPVKTYKGHENGMRQDLAQALEDLRPGVFRFPGGCIVEGADLATRYQWKNTVGPVENRPLNENRWHYTFTDRYFPNYFQSYGLGFFEYFQLSEEIGSEPLPVLNVGMACQFQNDTDAAHAPCTKEGLQQFIDDCIDLIDFANGDPATNKWAKLRAEMGHPAPFNLKFLGIGNEQWEAPYFDRLAIIAPEVRKAHPEIKIIGTSGPNAEDNHFYNGWKAMTELKADLVDEHFYRNIDWYKKQMNRYDDRKFYTKKGPRVFAGEYACHDSGKKWNHSGASLYEAAFMINIERNADLVHMATYAPLFAHVEGWQWRPDAIWFDNLRSARTTAYHVQALYAQNKGTNVLPTTLSINGGKASVNPVPSGEDGLFVSSVMDKNTNEIIIKAVNTTHLAQEATIDIKGVKSISPKATVITLDLSDYDADNTPDAPERVKPETTTKTLSVGKNVEFGVTIPARSFCIYKILREK
ncbi:MAG: carbohydrate binding domain-containing protein [Bacteroidaceae bacterium]|nr:carbohydrate binding domain-containing protein [Bacteroidaceae bacterium]